MERFDYDNPKEPQYAAYRSDPAWRRIYKFLQRGYWHVTSPQAWDKIRESGAIKPNIDGRYTVNFTERSYSYIHQCVALFDFASPSEEEIIQNWHHAWDVIRSKPTTVLLRLDRRRLHSKIIPNSQARQWLAEGKVANIIPFCEVWCPEEIPIVAVSHAYRVSEARAYELNPIQISKTERVEPGMAISEDQIPIRPELLELLEHLEKGKFGVIDAEYIRRMADQSDHSND